MVEVNTLSAERGLPELHSAKGPLVECVPNFSEGTDPAIVQKIILAMQVEGLSLLDWSLDRDHHRSVVTLAGAPQAIVEAAVRGVGRAAGAD